MAQQLTAAARLLAPAGDFNAWVNAEQRRVYLLCLRLLRDRDEANTAAQDVFLKAYRAVQRGQTDSLEEPAKWLTRVTVNVCLDRLRSRRWQFWRRWRAHAQEADAVYRSAASAAPSPEDYLFAAQIRERLDAALARLTDRQRAVFVLKHYEDRSLEEIAHALGLEIGSVKSHMARALAKLRGELRDLYGAIESET
ncbi:MAG: sigma-70 family RNA polymerase sigma factor [Acidobacteria bacterium]|nr:sigma-70 family RNA polymerase sigma factor [Acidobacteriota bacterium]